MCWHSFQHMSFFIPHASHLRMRMCAGVPPDTPWAGAGSKEEAAWLLPNKEGRKTEGSAWNLKLGREIQIELLFPEHTSANPIWLSCPLTPRSSPTDQESYRGNGVWHSSGDCDEVWELSVLTYALSLVAMKSSTSPAPSAMAARSCAAPCGPEGFTSPSTSSTSSSGTSSKTSRQAPVPTADPLSLLNAQIKPGSVTNPNQTSHSDS